MNQKSIELYNLNPKKIKYKNAQEIEDRGFFIGLHTTPLSNEKLKILVKNLLLIDEIK
jgi:CDP-6-deoxy-D-xylo-4-hexulose-3-dehydrase